MKRNLIIEDEKSLTFSEFIKQEDLKPLITENERIRKELDLFLFDNGLFSENQIKHIFIKIEELINNEIEQEKFCNF